MCVKDSEGAIELHLIDQCEDQSMFREWFLILISLLRYVCSCIGGVLGLQKQSRLWHAHLTSYRTYALLYLSGHDLDWSSREASY